MLSSDTAIDSWRRWGTPLDTRPAAIRELGGGRSNRSFMLESGSEKMVLRVNALTTALPTPNRSMETGVWRAASEAGIAPQLLYADPDGAFLVSAYIKNELPERTQDDPKLAEQALDLLQRCHRLQADAPVIDYATHIEHYWQIIQDMGASVEPVLRGQRESMRLLLQDITRCDTPPCLCHHDPVVENFVGSPDRLYLIDWEYAAHGLAIMDYAAFAVEWGIDDGMFTEQTGVEPALLANAKTLYRYICALWEAVNFTV